MGEQQSQESKQEAAGVEAPGQQKSSGESSIVIKVDGRGGNGPECATENHAGGE